MAEARANKVFAGRDPAPFWRFCPLLEFTPHFGDLRSAVIPTWRTWLFQRPSSHTHHSHQEPGEGRRLRDGEMLIIRGRQPTRHILYIYNITTIDIEGDKSPPIIRNGQMSPPIFEILTLICCPPLRSALVRMTKKALKVTFSVCSASAG